jgi:serine/threonine protein kinase
MLQRDKLNQKLTHLLEVDLGIHDILAEEGFFSKTKRFFLLPFTSKEIRRGLIKYLVKREEVTVDQFANEVRVMRWFGDNWADCVHVPVIYHSSVGTEGWYVTDYFNGQLLNDRNEDFFYSPPLLGQITPKEVVDFFYDLKKHGFRGLTLPFHDLNFLLPKHQLFLRRLENRGYGFSPETRRVLKNLFSNLDWLFDKNELSLIHNDLSPTNILVESGNFVFIDWENAAKASYLSDLVDFWARSGEFPVWQKKMFRRMVELFGEEVIFPFYRRFLWHSIGMLSYLDSRNKMAYRVLLDKVEEIVLKLKNL